MKMWMMALCMFLSGVMGYVLASGQQSDFMKEMQKPNKVNVEMMRTMSADVVG